MGHLYVTPLRSGLWAVYPGRDVQKRQEPRESRKGRECAVLYPGRLVMLERLVPQDRLTGPCSSLSAAEGGEARGQSHPCIQHIHSPGTVSSLPSNHVIGSVTFWASVLVKHTKGHVPKSKYKKSTKRGPSSRCEQLRQQVERKAPKGHQRSWPETGIQDRYRHEGNGPTIQGTCRQASTWLVPVPRA